MNKTAKIFPLRIILLLMAYGASCVQVMPTSSLMERTKMLQEQVRALKEFDNEFSLLERLMFLRMAGQTALLLLFFGTWGFAYIHLAQNENSPWMFLVVVPPVIWFLLVMMSEKIHREIVNATI